MPVITLEKQARQGKRLAFKGERLAFKTNNCAQAGFPCASATTFAAAAGSPEVNSHDYIIEGPEKSREETNIAVLQTADTRCLCNVR